MLPPCIAFTFAILSSFLFVASAVAETKEDGNQIRIGVVVSLTGYGAIGGAAEKNALELAAEDINATGGIDGKPIKLLIEDNHSEQKATANSIHRLASVEKVAAILGPNWTEFGLVAAPIAEQEHVVLLSTSAYAPELTRGRRFVFTVAPSHAETVRPLAEEIQRRGLSRVALIRSSNAFLEALTDGLKNSGLKFVREYQVNPGETDFRSIATQLKQKNVDGVVAFLLEGGDLQSFLRQTQEAKLSATIFSGTNIPTDPVILANKSLAEGVIFYDFKVPTKSEFWSQYKKRFGVEPWFTSPKAYDNLFLLREAMTKCGIDAAKIAACLENADYQGISGHIRFNQDHLLVSEGEITQVFQVQKGQFVPLLAQDSEPLGETAGH